MKDESSSVSATVGGLFFSGTDELPFQSVTGVIPRAIPPPMIPTTKIALTIVILTLVGQVRDVDPLGLTMLTVQLSVLFSIGSKSVIIG